MIRQVKTNVIPTSLIETNRYDGEDVKGTLLNDQHGKCYLCERELETDFVIEHIKSQRNYPDLRQHWNNLLISCGYCNDKKLNNYDHILNPLDYNIEEVITHELIFLEKKARFTSSLESEEIRTTIRLLNLIFNGTKRMRTIREERFFNHLLRSMNTFMDKTIHFLQEQNNDNKEAVKIELNIESEFLGFKYWIIKNNKELNRVFSNDIIWNKI